MRSRWQRWRWAVLVSFVVILSALITALIVPRDSAQHRLGPANPAPNGSRALVEILRHQGVDVQLRTNSRAAVAASTARSTLVVTNLELLGPEQLDRLAADDAADLVLVEPDELALSRLAKQLRTAGTEPARVRAPGCSVPAAQTAGRARAGGHLYSRTPNSPGSSGTTSDLVATTLCYPTTDNGHSGSYLVTREDNRKITVIGQSDVLTNRYLAQDGNAALALRSLGAQPELVWYTPDPLELAAGSQPPTLSDLLPDWVDWALVQLAVVVAVAMVWRARRLGRLVAEPLPVVVRAAETQEGRARLYRQASARGRAAATLRTAALRRLAGRLAAPSGTTPEQLVTLAAAATGRDEAVLQALLLGPAPKSDGALITLADDLDAVERATLTPNQIDAEPDDGDRRLIELKGIQP